MTDQIRQKVDTFLNFMKLPDGTPIVPLEMVDWLITKGFFTAPASTKYHGNHEGGLLEHSYMVAKALVDMSERERGWHGAIPALRGLWVCSTTSARSTSTVLSWTERVSVGSITPIRC